MFSFFKKVVSFVFPWGSDSLEYDLEENEQAILDSIKYMSVDTEQIPERIISEQQKLGQSDPVLYDVNTVRCIRKTGKVTYLSNDFGIIDEVIYFELSQVATGLVLKPSDEVIYLAYKLRENEAERVYQVYALKNDSWFSGDDCETENQFNNTVNDEEILAFTRVITGRVTQRRGREVFIESVNTWCNLDAIDTNFIPVEGDWVELQAVVSICRETADLSGNIVEVKSLKPLLTKNGFGRITLWSSEKQEGAIENLVYFTNNSCEVGYIPCLGDEVVYDAIESDQDIFRWRASKILPRHSKFQTKDLNNTISNNSCEKNDVNLFSNKNGISILPFVCTVEIALNQIKNIMCEVTNNGTKKQLLKGTKFHSEQSSQLVLLNPKLCDNFFIQPKETVQFEFQCEGKILGFTWELFFFYFENFTIAKKFEISVIGNRDMNKLLECKFDTVFKLFKDRRHMINRKVDADVVLYGPKPWKPPKFLKKERKCIFNVPKKLCAIMGENSFGLKLIKVLTDYAPYLNEDLSFEQYAERFHTLLYLEEIDLKINFRNYDLKGVFLQRSGDYFVLEVPGLVEKRPSIIVGDKLVLTQPWSKNEKVKHIGYIYNIRATEIFIKFHDSFHKEYDESECDVFFEPNTSFFTRCHEAVNRAIKVLGKQWLFPSAVNEKPAQIDFCISEETEVLTENVANFFKQIQQKQKENKVIPPPLKMIELESSFKSELNNFSKSEKKKKNLVWVNQSLNERQKLAVVNVLEGRGRPLPYIIFGPPGTGKTVTLVEIIIQLYRLAPESRILVSTPSNSSADLICERLIETGHFKPGQLLRLMALYRVLEGRVPAKLVPYSTFFDPRDNSKFGWEEKINIKSSSMNELAGRQRITVATCVTVGNLHYSGFPQGHFTHILVDEAGQTSEPEVLITATFQNSQNGQIVLAGDPQQLGPVICSPYAKTFGLETSLLQRFISTFPYARDFDSFPKTSGFDPRFITKLNVNYRSVPEILSLSSQLFYNADLIPTVSQVDSEEAKIIKNFNFEANNRNTPPALIFHGVIGQNYQEKDSPSWFNPQEIWQVVFYVRKLYSTGIKSDDLGIISPYAKQVQKLRILLSSLEMTIPKIGSVKEFQGQERYVIILSTVRSTPKYINSDILHCLGFVASPQRLNVALTRARALLIIIGNPILLSKDPYWRSVVKYCVENNSYTGCNLGTFGIDF